MRSRTAITACTYALLVGAAAIALALPASMTVSPAVASASASDLRLFVTVRDFRDSHVDFSVLPDLGTGHYAGNVQLAIGLDGRPVLDGTPGSGNASGAVVTGMYTGDGSDDRVIAGLDISPDLVMIKADDGEPLICRTSTMPGDMSKDLAENQDTLADRIQSIDADGFTIGGNNDVNQDGRIFYWAAFAARPGEMAVGTYDGDGTDDRDITGLGFDPDYVIVIPAHSELPRHRSSVMPAGLSFSFRDDTPTTNAIQSLITNGFRIGSDNDVNESGKPYHYVAWKVTAGQMSVGSYAGDGADDRTVTGAGFTPAYVMVKSEDAEYAMHRTAGLGAADSSLLASSSSNVTDGIQLLLADGFEVGSRNEVNRNGKSNYWAAFRAGGDVVYDGAAPVAEAGHKVLTQWRDAASNPMAPHMEGYGNVSEFTDYQKVGQTVVPDRPFAVMVECLGAAIYSGSYHRPVNARIRVGTEEFTPFGPYLPVDGNINDDQSATGNVNPGSNPRQVVLPQTFAAGQAVSAVGRSYQKINSGDSGLQNSHWETKKLVDSLAGSGNVIMLVNGDPVPEYEAYEGQDGLEAFVADYVDVATGTMTMCDNQVIFLYELALEPTNSSADFQDLVLLVTLADAPGDLPLAGNCGANPEDACGNPIADTSGSFGGASSGGITSADSFKQWFRDVLGVNLSAIKTLTLVDDGSGIYEFLADEFRPIDGQLLGDDGPNNNYFTLSFTASFAYESCVGQFIEFEGNDDAWMFIDDDLVIDLGGVVPGTNQMVHMDRMGLVDGETYIVRFFYAHRGWATPMFRLRTNIRMQSTGYPLASGAFD